MTRTLKSLLALTVERRASDLHLNVGIPPKIRIDGKLVSADEKIVTSEEAKALCFECLSKEQIARLEHDFSIDLSFGLEGISRFRGNVYWAQGNISGAFRTISERISKPEELGIPPVVTGLTSRPRGLILVTGATGSGKSTTLASLVEIINETRNEHIITIEDPIEFVYRQKKCTIHQREVGKDALNFPSALKYVLRQDPDIVLIGEMRDLETIQSAITIAETGHLVFATLHTNTTSQTIDRIIDVFPPHQQPQVRTQLSFILEGILCQQLLPKKGGGRQLALEILIPTPGIRNLIREGKTHQIFSQMQMGQQDTGMITLDQSLAKLVKEGVIEKSEALVRCSSRADLQKLLDE
ncbi:MAG: type IV pili twitching motility protein PilT [Deltaproteobacteria bacterium RIFCSPLOWO2_02_FULL_44_10]|nr:MAG: type IV pili twitching motility protein PilT [Deltaproteobacteria bacterium RIFCSPHIGHO2_02_FULL_44_16]OGQ46032.1 MAG: type IV pili twitching motility protein PilT [Deltaproteobacteria bacterium RIFCSPLOWO2_02_FULL_44_10]